MTIHECNSYCRDGVHTSLAHTPVEWGMDEVRQFAHDLMTQHGLHIVSITPAPEGAGMAPDAVWVREGVLLTLADTAGTYEHSPATHNTWLLRWSVDTDVFKQALRRHFDDLLATLSEEDRMEVVSAMDRSRREDGTLPGQGEPG